MDQNKKEYFKAAAVGGLLAAGVLVGTFAPVTMIAGGVYFFYSDPFPYLMSTSSVVGCLTAAGTMALAYVDKTLFPHCYSWLSDKGKAKVQAFLDLPKVIAKTLGEKLGFTKQAELPDGIKAPATETASALESKTFGSAFEKAVTTGTAAPTGNRLSPSAIHRAMRR